MSKWRSIRVVDRSMPPRRRCDHCRSWAMIYAWRVDDHVLGVRYCTDHAEAIIGPVELTAAGVPGGQTVLPLGV